MWNDIVNADRHSLWNSLLDFSGLTNQCLKVIIRDYVLVAWLSGLTGQSLGQGLSFSNLGGQS